jgi:hypothetical protein
MPTEDDARRIALSLPATTEKPSYGTPGFRVKDKLFARIHDLPDTLVVWVADMDEKEVLLASSPDRFFETPHYDGYPMLLVRLDVIGLDELREVLTDSWRVRAPRKVLPLLGSRPPDCSSGTTGIGRGGKPMAMPVRRPRAGRPGARGAR